MKFKNSDRLELINNIQMYNRKIGETCSVVSKFNEHTSDGFVPIKWDIPFNGKNSPDGVYYCYRFKKIGVSK